MAASNAAENLRRAKIASGFGFLNNTAGFDISQTLINFSAAGSTYGDAFIVGLLNTLLVSAIGIVLNLPRIPGRHRALSKNWMVAKVAMVYVEVLRNIPLLLQLLFWYIAVLGPLPQPRDSLGFGAGFFLNSRGLFMPRPLYAGDAWIIGAALVIGLVGTVVFRRWAKKQQEQTGRQYPVGKVTLALVLGLPLLAGCFSPSSARIPSASTCPRRGPSTCAAACRSCRNSWPFWLASSPTRRPSSPRWSAPASWRSPKGQTEAAGSLGLRPGQTLRLVVIPQAMRVIVPPLTSQYLNLTKNSSLAVAIGYPDLVQVFMGTVLNQTGQAIEVVVITMGVYLTISLVTSFVMNIYNRRVAIVER